MDNGNWKSKYLRKLLEEGKVFSNESFVLIDTPDKLREYFFVKFFNKDTEEQNERNLSFWRLSLVPVYINFCIFFSKKNDLQDFLETKLIGSSKAIRIDDIFRDMNLDFLKQYPEIDDVLHSWNPTSVYFYSDLISFLQKNIQDNGLSYQTALGLWYIYNLTLSQPTTEEIQYSPLLGGFIVSSIQMKKVFTFNNLMNE